MILNCVVKTHRYKRKPYFSQFIRYDKYDKFSYIKKAHDNRNITYIRKVSKITTSSTQYVSPIGTVRFSTLWKVFR